MANPGKKTKSKRMPAKRRYKIEKKVREHNRKLKKKGGLSKKLKKDPGVPNLCPFKEQLLKQAEERKHRAEQERERQKKERQKEHAKRRSLQGLQNDAQKRAIEFEKKQKVEAASIEDPSSESQDSTLSLRAYYKEFKKVVESADVILEVLDARDPLGCRCVQVENTVLSAGASKKLVLVLNKIDLVPKEIVEKWLKYLRNEFPTVAFKASTQDQRQNLSRRKFTIGSGPAGVVETSAACLGADVLMKLLGNYCRNAGIRTSITVGVVGLPNVGKSSIINSLKRSKACSVGAAPGVTKSLQEIQLDKHVKLLDSPGVIMVKESGDAASILLRNCVKVESISDPLTPVEAILRRLNHSQVMEHYCLPDFDGTQEFLSHLAGRLGKLKKGGIPNTDAAARSVLRDWNTGRIAFYTHPPDEQSLPSHISADIVREWGAAFDTKSLEEDEQGLLRGLSGYGKLMAMELSEPLHEGSVSSNELEEDMLSEEYTSESEDEAEEELQDMEGDKH